MHGPFMPIVCEWKILVEGVPLYKAIGVMQEPLLQS